MANPSTRNVQTVQRLAHMKFFLALFLCALMLSACNDVPRFIGPQDIGAMVAVAERQGGQYKLRLNLHKRVGGGFAVFAWCSSESTRSKDLAAQLMKHDKKAAFERAGWLYVGGAWIAELPDVREFESVVSGLLSEFDEGSFLINPGNPTFVQGSCSSTSRIDLEGLFASEFKSGSILRQVGSVGSWWLQPPLVHKFHRTPTGSACFDLNEHYVKVSGARYEICSTNVEGKWDVVRSSQTTAREIKSIEVTLSAIYASAKHARELLTT